MPKAYTAIRDALVARGKDYDAAQSEAAAIYNTTHKEQPVTGSHTLEPVTREKTAHRPRKPHRTARAQMKAAMKGEKQ